MALGTPPHLFFLTEHRTRACEVADIQDVAGQKSFTRPTATLFPQVGRR
jgi:hypothetical protein